MPEEQPASTQHAAPEEQASGRKGLLWRLQALVFEPRKAFEEIARNPTWLVAVLVGIALSIASATYMLQAIGVEQIVEMSMEQSGQDLSSLTDEQYEMTLAVTKVLFYVGPVFLTALFAAVLAGVFLICFMLIGGDPSFRRFFSVVVHTLLVYILITGILNALVITLKDPDQISNIQDPVGANLSFLFEKADSPVLHDIASSLDAPYLYFLFLTGMGLSFAARQRSTGSGLTVVFGLYALWVAGSAVITFVFS